MRVLSRAARFRSRAAALLGFLPPAERSVIAAYEEERERAALQQMSNMPLSALKKAAGGGLRLGAIESAGLRTVADVRAAGRRGLESIKGVGPHTSEQVTAASLEVEAALRKDPGVRFDVDSRPAEQTSLLSALRALEAARRNIEPLRSRIEGMTRAVEADMKAARLEANPVRRSFVGRRRKEAGRAALERLAALVDSPAASVLGSEMAKVEQRLSGLPNRVSGVWGDYAARSVAYNGLLIEVVGLGLDVDASQGFVPKEIVERIRGFDLDTSLLGASLRGYQSFGAKFALVQRRIILGDEMGLGKTIEALAVLCHLRSHGARHFLVVCPASVLVNWEHEIRRHSRLERIWRLHGAGRDRLLRQWVGHGGVAVTTFDTLRTLDLPDIEITAVVVDEAHYVKNPDAIRTRAVRSWLSRSKYSLLMSGTPMENRVEEFRTLVNHVRSDIASTISATDGIAGADAFRKAVAPVYLRRNQTDVLDELPPKVETAEWSRLEGAAAVSYLQAVISRNFMTMRRAAFMTDPPEESPKLRRLVEIAEEAADNGRKVVVFSFFLKVIRRVHEALGPLSVGTLTGSVSAPQRQLLVDRFSALRGPAVLISQIQAGGVGLNIQAASVVILTEPQWKPSTEEQAIARCHRLGQVRPVEVHRLLTENSVDERMLAILARKSALFADYVRSSTMKDAAPEAVDAAGLESTEAVVSQVEWERRIIELERRRLGLDT